MFIQINLLKVYVLNIYYSKDEKEKKKTITKKTDKSHRSMLETTIETFLRIKEWKEKNKKNCYKKCFCYF